MQIWVIKGGEIPGALLPNFSCLYMNVSAPAGAAPLPRRGQRYCPRRSRCVLVSSQSGVLFIHRFIYIYAEKVVYAYEGSCFLKEGK